MIKKLSNGTTYVCLLPWFRLIYRDGQYQGWYNPRLNKVI